MPPYHKPLEHSIQSREVRLVNRLQRVAVSGLRSEFSGHNGSRFDILASESFIPASGCTEGCCLRAVAAIWSAMFHWAAQRYKAGAQTATRCGRLIHSETRSSNNNVENGQQPPSESTQSGPLSGIWDHQSTSHHCPDTSLSHSSGVNRQYSWYCTISCWTERLHRCVLQPPDVTFANAIAKSSHRPMC